MRLLKRLFGRKSDPVAILEDSIERLQIGVTTNLIADYNTRLRLRPPSDAVHLAHCVLCYATAMKPDGESAQRYGKAHADLVQDEVKRLAAFAQVAKALSYLYAAMTMLIAIRTGDPFSGLSQQLGARATELSLHIPNTHDICGSDDAIKCIQAIATFAENYR